MVVLFWTELIRDFPNQTRDGQEDGRSLEGPTNLAQLYFSWKGFGREEKVKYFKPTGAIAEVAEVIWLVRIASEVKRVLLCDVE